MNLLVKKINTVDAAGFNAILTTSLAFTNQNWWLKRPVKGINQTEI